MKQKQKAVERARNNDSATCTRKLSQNMTVGTFVYTTDPKIPPLLPLEKGKKRQRREKIFGKIVEVEIQKTNKQTMFGKILNQFKTKEEFAA